MAARLAEEVREFKERSRGARRVFAVADVDDVRRLTALSVRLGVPRHLLIAYMIHRCLEAVEAEEGR